MALNCVIQKHYVIHFDYRIFRRYREERIVKKILKKLNWAISTLILGIKSKKLDQWNRIECSENVYNIFTCV